VEAAEEASEGAVAQVFDVSKHLYLLRLLSHPCVV
jgi:hypothetical protein